MLENLHLLTSEDAQKLEDFVFIHSCPLYTSEIEEEVSSSQRIQHRPVSLCSDRLEEFIEVVESCRRLKIPVRDYLGTILPGLANTPIQHVPELTPTAWIHSRTQA